MLKTIRILAVAVLTLASCSQSKNEKARELIDRYCETSLKYRGYRPLIFDEPQPWLGLSPDSAAKSRLLRQLDSTKLLLSKAPDRSLYKAKADSIERALNAINKSAKDNSGQQRWQVRHTYTYKKDKKGHVRATTIFIINGNFTRVLQAIDQ
ncbi:hypothetical protein [Mucilaginibacter paludis]|nr:hypothetical protein [Mucilaginibacter paludis]